jgi:hypothetical protein
MFETLFHYPTIIDRHRSGPFAEARERFLEHRNSRGCARATLQRCAQELLVVAERIDLTKDNAVESAAIETAAEQWAREQKQRKHAGGLRWPREFFIKTARDWLNFLGCLEAAKPKTVAFSDLVADFTAYRRDERGLSPATIRSQNWQVEKFLGWLNEQNRSFAHVCLEDVDAFLASKGMEGWCRVSVTATFTLDVSHNRRCPRACEYIISF